MRIEINNKRKVFAVQSEFNAIFPNLKLEFYEKPGNPKSEPKNKEIVSSSKNLEECRAAHNAGFITIIPGMRVRELKQNFSDVYSLSVDVFAKTANLAENEKPVSDDSVLEKINKELEPKAV